MPAQHDSLKDRLSRYSEIKISVTGRKSGRSITIPIWFVFDDDTLYLLPVQGSDTQWYKNVLENATMSIDARGAHAEVTAVPVADPVQVSQVIQRFRDKYGAGDVTKYYSKFDVAAVAQIL